MKTLWWRLFGRGFSLLDPDGFVQFLQDALLFVATLVVLVVIGHHPDGGTADDVVSWTIFGSVALFVLRWELTKRRRRQP